MFLQHPPYSFLTNDLLQTHLERWTFRNLKTSSKISLALVCPNFIKLNKCSGGVSYWKKYTLRNEKKVLILNKNILSCEINTNKTTINNKCPIK